MMNRDLEHDLLRWKGQTNPIPLLFQGARQVSKTYIVEKFGHAHFQDMVTINFELQPEMIHCFENLEPREILKSFFLLTGQSMLAEVNYLKLGNCRVN
jgi:uncharacterized protein